VIFVDVLAGHSEVIDEGLICVSLRGFALQSVFEASFCVKEELWARDWRLLIQFQSLYALEDLRKSVLQRSRLDVDFCSGREPFVADDATDFEYN
jgi:hypothetical protein